MLGDDRRRLRRFFTEAWNKQVNDLPMDPMQKVLAGIIQQHPEYHCMLEQEDLVLDKDFPPETGESNPFLHMSMHLSLQEQISIDRPPGITAAYRDLVMSKGDVHEAEHMMMECLAQMIWQAQRNNTTPNEREYLNCVQNLPGKQ